MLTDLPLTAADISGAVEIDGIIYFSAYDDTHGLELWKTDGTVLGTTLVKDIRPGSPGSNPSGLIDVGGTLYFTAYEDTHGTELWKSDGTADGTVLVKDIYEGSVSSSPQSLATINGTLYFTAYESTHGRELWKSDGTTLGTVLIKDIREGSLGSEPTSLTIVSGAIYFSAYENAHGRELWRTDGTTDGTLLVQDIRPGSPSSDPQTLTNMSGTLIFTADDGTHGRQLWTLAPTLWDSNYVCDYGQPLSVGASQGLLAGTTGLTDLELIDGPDHGSVTVNADGSFVYTPLSGFSGLDTFAYQATEGTTKTNVATAQIYVVQSLGNLVYTQFDVAVSAQPRWYSLETTRVGILSLQAAVATTGQNVRIELYDDGDLTHPLAVSQTVDGVQRIDLDVAAVGDTYYVKLVGNSTSADVRMANMVTESTTAVNVYGSAGDDTFEFVPGQTKVVTLNGITYTFASSTLTTIGFDGGLGNNTAILEGTTGVETATLRPRKASLNVGSLRVAVVNTSNITLDGNGGADVAYLYDSSGDDTFQGGPVTTTLSGTTFTNSTTDVATVHAISTAGGNDTAELSDSAGNDAFRTYPSVASMEGTGFNRRVKGFDRVTASAGAGGTDTAYLYDSSGDDTFVANSAASVLSGTGFENRALLFDIVHAFASQGNDSASFEGSASKDTLRIDPGQVRLSGRGYFIRAKSFKSAEIEGTSGGNDVAYLYASPGDDLLEAQTNWARLSNTTLDYVYRLVDFKTVQATAAASSNRKHVANPLTFTLNTVGPWQDV
jgi:ELWxxDGT repeat protein